MTTRLQTQLDELNRTLVDPESSGSTILDQITAMRGRSTKQSMETDMLIVRKYMRMRQCVEQMKEAQGELKQLVDKFMEPALHPAIFLELVTASHGELAMVVQSGMRTLVQIGDDIDRQGLERGDSVYLNQSRNVIVLKSAVGSSLYGCLSTISRILPDGRAVIKERDTQYLVSLAAALVEAELRSGDIVRWNEDASMIMEKMQPEDESVQFAVEDVPDTPPGRIGGMNSLLQGVLNRFVLSIANPGLAVEYGVHDANRRLLLEGPPGCGKTLLARVIASAIKRATGKPCRLRVVSGSEYYGPYVGETEARLASLLKAPADFDGQTIIFMDEVDAVARARGAGGNGHGDRFLSTLLGLLEGFAKRDDIVLIVATNQKALLDAAFVERFPMVKKLERPTRSSAREIFRVHMPDNLPVKPNADERAATIDAMIETAIARLYDPNAGNQVALLKLRDGKDQPVYARELISGRLIEQICVGARETAFQRHAGGGDPGIRLADIEQSVTEAIDRLGSTLSLENLRSHLALPTNLDVMAVEPVKRNVQRERYLQ